MTISRQTSTVGDSLHSLPHHLMPPCNYEYKGGAKFYGDIVDFKRQGMGIMMYPDGDLYEGNFDNGVKEGQGTQKWLDGSVYTGPFEMGKRHGKGVHQWPSGESYEGAYKGDMRWGEGTYSWPTGDKFSGSFVSDVKCGIGSFYFANGNVFKGEYKADERSGEGAMTYKSGKEDRGCWKGCSLVKLGNSVLPASLLDIQEPSSDPDMCDMREVTKGFVTSSRSEDAGPMGALETSSQALLLSALKGNNSAAVYLLQHTCVRPDVADSNGLTPLIAASVFCKDKIVNILLDNGANVNQLTDSGVSPLMACHLHLYFNSNCGYEIPLRKDPVHPCSADEELDGPIELFSQAEHSAKLPLDLEEEEEPVDIKDPDYEIPDEDVNEEPPVSVEPVVPDLSKSPSTTSEPTDGSDYTTVVVYGKRYFVHGPDILSDLELPLTGVVPTSEQLRDTIKLLLKRGADPKIGHIPVPVLILAILARDVQAVKLLLESGADPTARLGDKYGCKSPLHVAAGLRGPGGPEIVKLLLGAGADPNVRDSLSFSRSGALQWKLIEETDGDGKGLGSTPLQVACSMDHDYENSTQMINLLLGYGADTNVICNGHSPLTLGIYSGNDAAVETLLKSGGDSSLSLGSPIGSSLCAAVDTTCESRRTNEQRLEIINQLMTMGADIMALVPVGKSGKHMGTAVDYAMHVFYQDKRIANTPFHALSPAERDIYIARTNLLNHMSELLREEVQKREASLRDSVEIDEDGKKTQKPKMLFKYCYECGRSTGVKLTPCTRCFTVSFCSQRCKLKAWTSRHRRECIKLDNKQETPSDGRKKERKERLPSISPSRKPDVKEAEPDKKKKKGKASSVSKDIFGKKGKKGGRAKEEPEMITHTLPRLVNLQHSQI